jgi:hypothetical protein
VMRREARMVRREARVMGGEARMVRRIFLAHSVLLLCTTVLVRGCSVFWVSLCRLGTGLSLRTIFFRYILNLGTRCLVVFSFFCHVNSFWRFLGCKVEVQVVSLR